MSITQCPTVKSNDIEYAVDIKIIETMVAMTWHAVNDNRGYGIHARAAPAAQYSL